MLEGNLIAVTHTQ